MGSPCNGVQSLYSTATKGPISFIVLDVFFNDKSSNHKMPIQYVLPMWKSFYSTGRNFHLSLFGAFPLTWCIFMEQICSLQTGLGSVPLKNNWFSVSQSPSEFTVCASVAWFCMYGWPHDYTWQKIVKFNLGVACHTCACEYQNIECNHAWICQIDLHSLNHLIHVRILSIANNCSMDIQNSVSIILTLPPPP